MVSFCYPLRVNVGELPAHALPGPADAGLHRAERRAGRHGDLLVAQVGPYEQQQRVALCLGQAGKRLGEPGLDRARADGGVHPVGERLSDRVGAGAREQPQLFRLAAPVPVRQPGRDAVQPGQAVAALVGVACALPECDEERLGDDVLGRVAADAPVT